MSPKISIFGAARTVTGSRHLIEYDDKRVLIDCGIFQGSPELKSRNWQEFPFDVHSLDAVVLTHAHQDHIGMLPRLVKFGYKGPIYCTEATLELSKISLPDSGRIQEEDARHANKHGFTTHKPALPLYTEQDAYAALKLFKAVSYNESHPLPGGAQWRYVPSGHIMGAAFIEFYPPNGQKVLLSGDLGRYDTPIIKDPTVEDFADYLMIESTYGDRLHPKEDVMDKLRGLFNDIAASGGVLLVPSFAIGRTQELLYYIYKLQKEGLPRIPIYIDSPMATSTTKVYMRDSEEHDPEMAAAVANGENMLEPQGLTLIRDREQSKALNSQSGPMVIIAGSGMANGGRIQHHLLHRLSRPETIVLFTGFQAEGTLGRRLLEGADRVHMLGHEIPVAARIEKANALSAHADQGEIMRWLSNFKTPPKLTMIVHGEPAAQDVLRAKIEQELGWKCATPNFGDSFELV